MSGSPVVARRGDTPLRAALLLLACALLALAHGGGRSLSSSQGTDAEVRALLAQAPRLLVADLRGHALVELDLAATATGQEAVVSRTPLPGAPHELLALPDGRILASLEREGLLALLDTASGALELREVGGLPHGLALQGDVLHVTDRSQDAVRRFRLGSGALADAEELAALDGGHWPHAVALLPGGTPVVAAAADGTLRFGEITFAVSELPETVALSADGRTVATAGALGGDLELLDASGEPLARHALGGRPVRVIFGPGDGWLAVALSATGEVALVDADALPGAPDAVRRVTIGGIPDGLAAAGDGLLIAGDLLGGRITLIDVARGAAIASVDAGEGASALLVLPRRGEPRS